MSKRIFPVERIAIPISPNFVERIDDFRFAKRIPSRAAAMRALMEIGLNHPDDYGRRVRPSKSPKP